VKFISSVPSGDSGHVNPSTTDQPWFEFERSLGRAAESLSRFDDRHSRSGTEVCRERVVLTRSAAERISFC